MEKKDMVLNEEAGTISGTRHVIYNDKAAQLVKATERLMLDLAKEGGYRIVEPPVIVNREALYNTGQLPKFEEDLFKLTNDQYLIPTAEVPLTNLAANKIFKEEELPIKLTGGTNCFRSEAGSAGRDTRGIVRLHQFRKVELVQYGLAKNEEQDFNAMLAQASKVLDTLGLKYRHLLLCTGDMSFGSRKTVDIEV
jgi:seryl-tRNA synthetase